MPFAIEHIQTDRGLEFFAEPVQRRLMDYAIKSRPVPPSTLFWQAPPSPAIFPPVVIDGEPLMDGAVAANTPVRLAAELGASRIVILPTGYACALKEPPKTPVGKALHAITLMIAWQLMHELENTAKHIQVHLAPTLCPLAVSPFDFSSSRELIERAARSTQDWIEDGGLTRRAQPEELAPHRH